MTKLARYNDSSFIQRKERSGFNKFLKVNEKRLKNANLTFCKKNGKVKTAVFRGTLLYRIVFFA